LEQTRFPHLNGRYFRIITTAIPITVAIPPAFDVARVAADSRAGGVPVAEESGTTARPRLRENPWVVLVSLCLGFFMILLDTTIVNVAIPSMIDGLGATLDQILWVVNAYVLVYAVLLITAGRLGDMWGPKPLFLVGMALFTVASVACGLADSPAQLITARVAQGVGGALLTPQSLSIITQIFPPDRRGAAFGLWGSVAGLAAVTGPTLGGFIVTRWGWEWIFFVNLPIGILSLALAVAVVPDLRPQRRHRLDLVGTALATAALFFITFGLIEGEQHDWGRIWGGITIPELIGAGVVLLVVFLVVQYRAKGEPLVPFALLRDRNFSLMMFVGGAMAFGLLGLFVPFLIYLQSVLGLSAMQAGFTVAPMALTSIFVSPFAGRLADRVGGKYVLMTGLSFFATGTGYLIWTAQVDSGRWTFLPGLITAGVGMGFTFPPMTTLAMRDVVPHLAGAASGVLNTTRQLGGVIGSAAVGALLQAQLSAHLRTAAERHAADLPAPYRDDFVAAFSRAATGGLKVGRGQTGAALPDDLPAEVGRVAATTFHEGFVGAMRPSLALAIGVLATAALSCVFIRGRRPAPVTPASVRAGQSGVSG
jgi:EmrB/QacA subfamily drug resistance transporter